MQPRVVLSPRPAVVTGVDGFLPYRTTGPFHRKQDADSGALAVHPTTQVAEVGHGDVTGLNREDYLFDDQIRDVLIMRHNLAQHETSRRCRG